MLALPTVLLSLQRTVAACQAVQEEGLPAAFMPQSVVGVSLGASENPLRSQERPLWCESREQI